MIKGNPKLVQTLYLYGFSALGLILLIVGIFKLTEYGVKRLAFDEYYLPYEAGRCTYVAPIIEPDANQKAFDKQNEIQRKICLEDLEKERNFKKVTDLSSAVTFVVVGSVVFFFHYRRARNVFTMAS